MDELQEIKNTMRGNISEKEFWTSRSIAGYFTDIAKAVLNKYGSDFQIKVHIIYEPKGAIAYTTFDAIVLNAACIQVEKIVRRQNKVLYLKGLLAHELSHILYMDKSYQEKYFKQMLCGVLLPRIPKCKGEEMKLVNAIMDKQKVSIISSISKHLINIVEDGYGENTYLANYYGSLTDGMRYMRKEFYKDLQLSEEIEKLLADDDPKKQWGGVTSILLVYALYHRIKGDGEYPISFKIVDRVKPILDKSLKSDFKDRLNLTNELMIVLWDYIEKLIESNEKDKNENDSERNGNSGLPMPNTGKPDHSNDSGMTRPVTTQQENSEPTQYNPDAEERILNESSSLDDIEEQVLDELSRKKLENKNLKRMNREANEGDSYGCKVDIYRAPEVTSEMIAKYSEYDEAILTSRKIQKSIKQQLDDRRNGGKKSGLYIGQKLEFRQVIKGNGKYFYNNKLPTNTPRIAVFVIIDESGSMDSVGRNGKTRIEMARATAVIVEDFCRNLGFPVCIIGSTADWKKKGHSELTVYSSFNSADKNDCYRLMDINSKSCNRDGAALAYGFNEMRKRPEEIKLMFIISDGKPNASGYGGIYAIKELKEIHEKCNKAGIVTFAAAIGDDKKKIEEIYGDSFLDITDLDAMPKIFIDRIKRFIAR